MEDLAEVWDHIADDSLRAADRWVDQLDEQFQLLATQPLMGRARGDLSPRLRSFPFGRYLIFYEPVEDGIDGPNLGRKALSVTRPTGRPRVASK